MITKIINLYFNLSIVFYRYNYIYAYDSLLIKMGFNIIKRHWQFQKVGSFKSFLFQILKIIVMT
jgi:hypothetical protein